MTTSSDNTAPVYATCPHCGDIYICEHVALAVDLTFREILGGYLEKSLSKELKNYSIATDDNLIIKDQRFDDVVRYLRSSGNFIETSMTDNIFPGSSSSYSIFFSRLCDDQKLLESYLINENENDIK